MTVCTLANNNTPSMKMVSNENDVRIDWVHFFKQNYYKLTWWKWMLRTVKTHVVQQNNITYQIFIKTVHLSLNIFRDIQAILLVPPKDMWKTHTHTVKIAFSLYKKTTKLYIMHYSFTPTC